MFMEERNDTLEMIVEMMSAWYTCGWEGCFVRDFDVIVAMMSAAEMVHIHGTKKRARTRERWDVRAGRIWHV